ncbi:hypothetical protein KIPB_009497, partial [Kipferlia bialata]
EATSIGVTSPQTHSDVVAAPTSCFSPSISLPPPDAGVPHSQGAEPDKVDLSHPAPPPSLSLPLTAPSPNMSHHDGGAYPLDGMYAAGDTPMGEHPLSLFSASGRVTPGEGGWPDHPSQIPWGKGAIQPIKVEGHKAGRVTDTDGVIYASSGPWAERLGPGRDGDSVANGKEGASSNVSVAFEAMVDLPVTFTEVSAGPGRSGDKCPKLSRSVVSLTVSPTIAPMIFRSGERERERQREADPLSMADADRERERDMQREEETERAMNGGGLTQPMPWSASTTLSHAGSTLTPSTDMPSVSCEPGLDGPGGVGATDTPMRESTRARRGRGRGRGRERPRRGVESAAVEPMECSWGIMVRKAKSGCHCNMGPKHCRCRVQIKTTRSASLLTPLQHPVFTDRAMEQRHKQHERERRRVARLQRLSVTQVHGGGWNEMDLQQHRVCTWQGPSSWDQETPMQDVNENSDSLGRVKRRRRYSLMQVKGGSLPSRVPKQEPRDKDTIEALKASLASFGQMGALSATQCHSHDHIPPVTSYACNPGSGTVIEAVPLRETAGEREREVRVKREPRGRRRNAPSGCGPISSQRQGGSVGIMPPPVASASSLSSATVPKTRFCATCGRKTILPHSPGGTERNGFCVQCGAPVEVLPPSPPVPKGDPIVEGPSSLGILPPVAPEGGLEAVVALSGPESQLRLQFAQLSASRHFSLPYTISRPYGVPVGEGSHTRSSMHTTREPQREDERKREEGGT